MSNLHTTAGPGANGQVEPTVATHDLRTRLMLKAPIGRTLLCLSGPNVVALGPLQALGIAGGVPGPWRLAAPHRRLAAAYPAGPEIQIDLNRKNLIMNNSTSDTSATSVHYLDDLKAGDRFVSAEHALDASQIKAFALQFDPQPFHLDHEAAMGTLFGGLAASGWHTAALTMRLLVDGGLPLAGGIVGAGGEIAWPKPTRPGDVLHVVTEVVSVTPSRSRPDRGMVVVRSETRNQQGDVLQHSVYKLVVPRRPE